MLQGYYRKGGRFFSTISIAYNPLAGANPIELAQAPDQVLRPATDGGLCWRAAPQRGLSRIRLERFSQFKLCRGLAAGQGRQRKGGARCLCKGRAAARAGRSARARQRGARRARRCFWLGRAPAGRKGRQRASDAVFCCRQRQGTGSAVRDLHRLPGGCPVFVARPARARPQAPDAASVTGSGSATSSHRQRDVQSTPSAARRPVSGSQRQSGRSQRQSASQGRVRAESGRKLSNDFNESADCSQESGLGSSARPPHPVAAAAPLLF
jgi:hypothetical protein